MMPPGHVAVTWAGAQLWPHRKLDYRWLALCGLLPDIIDKPLALLVFTASESTQNVAHALLPHLLVLLIALLWRPRWVPYALAFNSHLLADRMWNHTETFWWPFFGWETFWQFKFMNTPQAMLNTYLDIVRRYPQVWVIEVLALGYLAWLAIRYGWYRWPELRRFLQTARPADNSHPHN